jgi:hypothetical protein
MNRSIGVNTMFRKNLLKLRKPSDSPACSIERIIWPQGILTNPKARIKVRFHKYEYCRWLFSDKSMRRHH